MINVLISVNHAYLPHAQVMLRSLMDNTEESISVYLLNHELNDDDISYLDIWIRSQNCIFHTIDVSQTDLDGLPSHPGQFSIEMYYRIIAQYILPVDLDRILWLDADIVVLKSLSSFYHQNFDGKCLIVCPDRNGDSDFVNEIKDRIGIAHDHVYFNSGVLLLNLLLLRKTYTFSDIISSIIDIQDRLTYPDQDFLNYIYQGKVKYCDWRRFNYQVDLDQYLCKDTLNNIDILHYTGFHKPWLYRYLSPVAIFYWRIAKKLDREDEFRRLLIKGIFFWPLAQIRELRFRVKKFFVSYLKR